jgi:hypothetical protein
VFRLDHPTGGTVIGTIATAPYSFTWSPAGTAPGSHTIYAIATDNANNATTSAGVTISIPVPPPTITIALSPPSPARKTTATITATASVTAPVTVTKVEFFINGSLVGTDTTSPYTYAWKIPAATGKTYTLSARVTDSLGRTATSSPLTVTPK